ncbi:MAG TPA: amidohydrolase family protein [Xanthobacteraceae bacterium]|nr:amidohydrolase family protein [Xanthobacteraceae bacterium]
MSEAALLLTGGQVLDADGTRFRRCDIRIRGAAIDALAEHIARRPGERVLAADGLFLLPGLIDAHVHAIGVQDDLATLHRVPPYLVAAKAGRVLAGMLARGFTSVRDAGGADGSLAECVGTGLFAGPRLFPSGRGLAPPGAQGDFRAAGEADLGCPCCGGTRSITRLASGVAALRAAVRAEIAAGATQIKVMASGGIASPAGPEAPQYAPEELDAVVDEAARAGRGVLAHAYGAAAIRRCVEAGVRSIEHGSGLDAPTADLMARRGTVLVPTLVVFDRIATGGGPLADTAKRIFDESCRSIALARACGVAIAHGSDLEGAAHAHQSDEFRLKAAEMPLHEVIASATQVGAGLIGMGDRLGRLAPGALADLIGLDADPLAGIAPLARPDRHLLIIIKDGTVMHDRRPAARSGAPT